tara:strand:+ start:8074 stop:8907 length:834 start_codon:yes stop_codon:yes gene_type:complete
MEKTENQSITEATVEGADASVEKADASVDDTSVEGVVATDTLEVPKSSDPVGQRPVYNIQTSLDPTLDTHLKRVSVIAVGAVFLCVIMMMVTGGRLASEVDNLQAATLSLTKRVVNMNSGLERFATLDTRFELLDLGQASILDGNTELRLANSELMGVVSEEVSKLSNSLDERSANINSLTAQMSSIREVVAEQEKGIGSLSDRFDRLERQVASLKGLERDIRILVEIEQGNLKELFRQQLELEEQELLQGTLQDGTSEEPKDPRLDGVVTFSTSRD